MTKIKDICKVCGSRKLINFARLCKRCNREKAGVKIRNEVLKNLVIKAEEAAKQKELEAAQAAGRNKVEEEVEETPESKPEGEAKEESTKEEEKK